MLPSSKSLLRGKHTLVEPLERTNGGNGNPESQKYCSFGFKTQALWNTKLHPHPRACLLSGGIGIYSWRSTNRWITHVQSPPTPRILESTWWFTLSQLCTFVVLGRVGRFEQFLRLVEPETPDQKPTCFNHFNSVSFTWSSRPCKDSIWGTLALEIQNSNKIDYFAQLAAPKCILEGSFEQQTLQVLELPPLNAFEYWRIPKAQTLFLHQGTLWLFQPPALAEPAPLVMHPQFESAEGVGCLQVQRTIAIVGHRRRTPNWLGWSKCKCLPSCSLSGNKRLERKQPQHTSQCIWRPQSLHAWSQGRPPPSSNIRVKDQRTTLEQKSLKIRSKHMAAFRRWYDFIKSSELWSCEWESLFWAREVRKWIEQWKNLPLPCLIVRTCGTWTWHGKGTYEFMNSRQDI